jgi:glycosyltransferase involved in cell wall biosynthesis
MEKIVIFIPVHNEELNIEKTISSILSQDFENFDLIVSENHSTDSTADILRHLELRDSRIKILRPPEKTNGYGNFVFLTNYINQFDYYASMMLGGHDLLSRTVISSNIKNLKETQGCAISYQERAFEIDENDAVTRQWPRCHASGHMNTSFDTFLTLISLMYNVPIFGLWRHSVRKKVHYRYPCVGGDHLYVAEAAIHGSITAIGEGEIYLRRSPPTANYLEKHFLLASGDDAAAADMYVQLSWLSTIIDEASCDQPPLAKELFRTSAICLYLMRYNHHFQTFQSSFGAFASGDFMKEFILGQVNFGLSIKEFLEKRLAKDSI